MKIAIEVFSIVIAITLACVLFTSIISSNNQNCYARDYYKDLAPRVLLSYERDAYYSTDDPNFRITFDSNVLWRDTDVNLHTGIYGNPILPKGYVLMELKTAGGLPLWMTKILSEEKIYKTSFSKYGTAYKTILARDGKVKQFAYNYNLGMKGVFNYV